jgi:HK97 family phage portal protein
MAKLNFRSAIKAIFTGIKTYSTSIWKEIGVYRSTFSSFGGNIYANDVARACIRSLAEHSSKANVKVIRRVNGEILKGDQKLQDMITYRPNQFMNGKDFLYKIRTILEITNTVFIYIMRNEIGNCVGLYPMPNGIYEAVDVGGNLYIKFSYPNGIVMAHSWDDLAVLRKDYNSSDIFGDSNDAILTSLELLNTTNQGMANAIKSTSNLRGILKSTKAMLSDEDVKKAKDRFVADYTAMENESGIASIDSTQEFMPIRMTPAIANYKSVEELRMNIHRYFGTNDKILTSDTTSDQREAFYESRIEPFLLALSLELTYKIYNSRMRGFGNELMYESNRMSYMSMSDKLALVAMVDRGALTPNEWRDALNLAPIDGGDKPIRRLDTALTTDANTAPNVKEVEDDDKQG